MIFKASVTILALMGCWYVLGLALVYSDPCRERFVTTAISPLGERNAYVVTEDCGKSQSTRLLIVSRETSVGTSSDLVATATSTYFKLHWTSEMELLVVYPKDLDIAKPFMLEDVRIRYRGEEITPNNSLQRAEGR